MFHLANCILMDTGSSPHSSFICGSGSGLRAYHNLMGILLWLHGRGLSFTLEPWANSGVCYVWVV